MHAITVKHAHARHVCHTGGTELTVNIEFQSEEAKNKVMKVGACRLSIVPASHLTSYLHTGIVSL